MKKIRVEIKIFGYVQGVFFRANLKKFADKLGAFGWARNSDDGAFVEVVLEGEEEKVKQIIEWCRRGPLLAKVEKVDVKLSEWKNEFRMFEIKH